MTPIRSRVAVLWPGRADGADPDISDTRLAAIADTLASRGLTVLGVPYTDERVDDVAARLREVDGVLVWVNPIDNGRDRTVLDALLEDVARAGVRVSAHPDVIRRMGTKEVLHRTAAMGWGSDTRIYRTYAEMREALPLCLAEGSIRVLKRHRGNGGSGVWKVEPGANDRLRVRQATRGSEEETLPFDDFMQRLAPYFDDGGFVIDQVYQPRLADGMVRCYLVRDRVAGFGEQRINALLPTPPGPRLYYPPTRADLQLLKSKLEGEWVAELCARVGIASDSLPIIWDADFLYGPKTAAGEDTYVLCEINVSSVFPFPDEALAPLADATLAWLSARRS